ncbi:MAG: hypothetical protein FJY20_06850 [Bacteroidetes bacterium]|nr:hypothetical protein [Bacteroidota bacterium]
MALMFNKWFGLAAFPLFYLVSGDFCLSDARSPLRRAGLSAVASTFVKTSPDKLAKAEGLPHPFHVSVIEINHNAADKTLEISCKIFTDDFEKALAKNYKTKVDLINPPDKAKMDTLVKRYLFSHLSIKANGKPVRYNYLGFENDHEAAYGYIEVPDVPSVNKFDISASILYDMFDDQMNIFHVIVSGNRKSTRLNYPDKETVVSF